MNRDFAAHHYHCALQELSYRKQIASAAHIIRRGHIRDLEIYVNGHSRSLETEPLDIHDLLLDELLDVEYYRDLEMWVRGHSRSLIVVPFENLGTVS